MLKMLFGHHDEYSFESLPDVDTRVEYEWIVCNGISSFFFFIVKNCDTS
jgi:hypothetical protein